MSSTLTVQNPLDDPESDEFRIASGYVRAMILMGMADEKAAKTGGEPFEYEDQEVRTLCHAWHEGFKRARTDSRFWDLLDKTLSTNCKSLLGFNSIPRPSGVNAW